MKTDVEALKRELDERGHALWPGAIDVGRRDLLASLLPADGHAARNLLWNGGGLHAALEFLGVEELARSVLGADAVPINALYLDKTAGANWKVPGHQDLMMPVEREEAEPGWSGWCTKAGVVHAEPPAEVLETLLTIRIHLDDCPASNGALAVIPASHRRGKLDDAALGRLAPEAYVVCGARAGDLLLMRPLLVHRSSPATEPHHRRVLQVTYAPAPLANEVQWRTSLVRRTSSPAAVAVIEPLSPPTSDEVDEAHAAARAPEKARRSSRWQWLWFLLPALMFAVFGGLVWAMVQRVQSGDGGVHYRTLWGYKFNPIGALVLIVAAFVITMVVGPIVTWWHHRHQRDFDRKYPRPPGDPGP